MTRRRMRIPVRHDSNRSPLVETFMRKSRRFLPMLLVVPYVALLWVPFYNRAEPVVGGFPFFYVWMFVWVVLAAILTWIVHRGTRA